MLQEINNFMNTLSPELKQAGLKPKEGLHVLLKVQEKDGVLFMDEKSVEQVCLTRKATEFDEPFLQRCAELAQVSWCVNTNKCFDLPAKGIHSCSPYCVALKRESLEGGGKYSKDKIKIYDRVEAYFTNAVAFVVEEEEKERISVFRNFINSREKLNALFGYFQADFEEVKDKEYIILYLDEAIEKYRQVNEWYLSDKLFNTNEFNVKVGNEIYGTSDFLNGFPTKKPFLSHQSAVFDIAGRITGEMARNLHSFQEIMLRNILPRPLPLFVYREELQTEELSIFSKYLSEGKKIGYQEIIRDELNVKAVSFTDDVRSFTTYSFKPQLKTVGPKYGKSLNGIRTYLAEVDGNAAMDELKEKGSLTFDVNGVSVVLSEEDLLIDMAQTEGYVSDGDNEITVVLDTKLTPELIEEGFIREIISKVQTMRKDSGFEVMDHISVSVTGNNKIADIVRKNASAISEKVLADEILYAEALAGAKAWKVNGEEVEIGVQKR